MEAIVESLIGRVSIEYGPFTSDPAILYPAIEQLNESLPKQRTSRARQVHISVADNPKQLLAHLRVHHVFVVHCPEQTERKDLFVKHWNSVHNPFNKANVQVEFVTVHDKPEGNFSLHLDDISENNNNRVALTDSYKGHCSALYRACEVNQFPAIIAEDNVMFRPLAKGQMVMNHDEPVTQSMGHIKHSPSGCSSNPKLLYFAQLSDCQEMLKRFLSPVDPDPEQRGRAYIADKMYLNGTALPATHEPLFGADSESVSTIAVDTSIGREATEEEEYLDVFLTLPKRQSAAAQRGARVSKKRKRNRAQTTGV